MLVTLVIPNAIVIPNAPIVIVDTIVILNAALVILNGVKDRPELAVPMSSSGPWLNADPSTSSG